VLKGTGDYWSVPTGGVTKACLKSTLEAFATSMETLATFLDK
jgi:hypothetical protein